MFPEIKELPQKPIAHLNILRGISKLAETGLIEISGLYIDKNNYGGRYIQWCESKYNVPPKNWPYYLRMYLLRHLLEIHFSDKPLVGNDEIDLVLDRVLLSESQRENLLNYLNSKTPTKLITPFKIPPIKTLTEADSQYVGALQLTHILAELLNDFARNRIIDEKLELASHFKVVQFLGYKQPNTSEG